MGYCRDYYWLKSTRDNPGQNDHSVARWSCWMVQPNSSLSKLSAGDGSEKLPLITSAYYNYHSMPITTRVGIENLIKFVTAKISLGLLQFFFCCDVRLTPTEIIEQIEHTANCEILHLPFTSSYRHLDLELGLLILRSQKKLNSLVLISDAGDFSDCLRHFSDVLIFHPPGVTFCGHRSIELPCSLDSTLKTFKVGKNSLSGKLNDLNKILNNAKSRLESFVIQLEKESPLPEFYKASVDAIKTLKTIGLAPSEAAERTQQILSAVLADKTNNMEDFEEKVEAKEEKQPIKYGNGWDDFEPNANLVTTGGGWDEIDKEIAAEQGGAGVRAQPFQEKKNPFGGNPFEGGKYAPIPAPVPMASTISDTYNQDLFSDKAYRQQNSSTFSNCQNESSIMALFNRNHSSNHPCPSSSFRKPPFQNHYHQMAKPNPFKNSSSSGSSFISSPRFQHSQQHFSHHQPGKQIGNPFTEKFPDRSAATFDQEFPRLGSMPITAKRSPSAVSSCAPGSGQRNPWLRAPQRAVEPMKNGQFSRKFAPQCPQWEDYGHKIAGRCVLFHPNKFCLYFPNCQIMATGCHFAHPFCSDDVCRCEEEKNPQLNHFLVED